MGSSNRYEGIEPYAVGVIRAKAREVVGYAGFGPSDIEDVEQDLVLDYLSRIANFDPARGERRHTIRRIIHNKVASILAARGAQARDPRREGPSLDETVIGKDGVRVPRGATLDQESYLRTTRRPLRTAEERRDLTIDLAEAVADLSADDRALCVRLTARSVAEVARETGIARSVLYEARRRIRARFQAAGLDRYHTSRAPGGAAGRKTSDATAAVPPDKTRRTHAPQILPIPLSTARPHGGGRVFAPPGGPGLRGPLRPESSPPGGALPPGDRAQDLRDRGRQRRRPEPRRDLYRLPGEAVRRGGLHRGGGGQDLREVEQAAASKLQPRPAQDAASLTLCEREALGRAS